MKILLDTCAIFYIAEQSRLTPDLIASLDEAAHSGKLCVSLISAWEIGMLAARSRVRMTRDPSDYFQSFMDETGALLCSLDAAIMTGSSYLPGVLHADPMDRLLIETARSQDLTLMTSDRAILTYGREGHVKTMPC